MLGGSQEYTGAPFYAAISALRSGADLSHIFTPSSQALVPLKSYSPEIIVHEAAQPQDLISWQQALHSLVAGPGLGRDKSMPEYLEEVVRELG